MLSGLMRRSLEGIKPWAERVWRLPWQSLWYALLSLLPDHAEHVDTPRHCLRALNFLLMRANCS